MEPLKNAKHEKFALAMANGMPLSRAYLAAGYKATGNAAEVGASRLAKQKNVAERIAHIRGRQSEVTADSQALTKLWVIEMLMRNAKICMGDLKAKDAEGVECYQRDAKAANAALQLLGKELGMFVDRAEVSGSVTWSVEAPQSASEAEWASKYAN